MKREYGRFGFGSFVARAFLALAFLFLAVFSGHAFAEDDEKAYPTMYPPGKSLHFTDRVSYVNSHVDMYDVLNSESDVTVEALVCHNLDDDTEGEIFQFIQHDTDGDGKYDGGYRLFVRCDGECVLEWRIGHESQDHIIVTYPIESGKRYHVAGTMDNLYMKLYIDGELVAKRTSKPI